MWGATARHISHTPVTFVSCTWRNSSNVSSSIGPRMLMPALLIRTSIRPKSATTCATVASICSGSVTSQPKPRHVGPWAACSSSAAAWACRASRLATTTWAPASASAPAITAPSPRLPPVMMATRSSMRKRSRMPMLFLLPVTSAGRWCTERRSVQSQWPPRPHPPA